MKGITALLLVLALVAAVLASACGQGGPETVGPSGRVGPDTGIAFVSDDPVRGTPRVYLVDADSGAVQQLTKTEESEWWPTWSRDRQRLAFIVSPAPNTGQEGTPTPEDIAQRRLLVTNADGTGQRPMGDSVPVQDYSGGLSWSPDGSEIVYMTVDPTESPRRLKLHLVNVADGSEVPLPEERLGFLPAWSPDGTKILFGAFVGELDEQGKGESELFLMDSDGENIRQITNRPGTDVDASWSPDGTRIAWWGEKLGSGPSQPSISLLFMMDVASGEITELGEGSDPIWSPDGQHIAFVLKEKPPPGVIPIRPNVDIHSLDVQTGERTQLTQDPSPDLSPTWSPDGRRIAFVSQRDNLTGEIYVMNADGSDVRLLTQNNLTEMMLAWAPQ